MKTDPQLLTIPYSDRKISLLCRLGVSPIGASVRRRMIGFGYRRVGNCNLSLVLSGIARYKVVCQFSDHGDIDDHRRELGSI